MGQDLIRSVDAVRKYRLNARERATMRIDERGEVPELSVIELVLRSDPGILSFDHADFSVTVTESGRNFVRSTAGFSALPAADQERIKASAYRRAALQRYIDRHGATQILEALSRQAGASLPEPEEEDGEEDDINPFTGLPVGDADAGINPFTGLPVGGAADEEQFNSSFFDDFYAERAARKQRREEFARGLAAGVVKAFCAVGTGIAQGLANSDDDDEPVAHRPEPRQHARGSSPPPARASSSPAMARPRRQRRTVSVVRVRDGWSQIMAEEVFEHGSSRAFQRKQALERLFPSSEGYRTEVYSELRDD